MLAKPNVLVSKGFSFFSFTLCRAAAVKTKQNNIIKYKRIENKISKSELETINRSQPSAWRLFAASSSFSPPPAQQANKTKILNK